MRETRERGMRGAGRILELYYFQRKSLSSPNLDSNKDLNTFRSLYFLMDRNQTHLKSDKNANNPLLPPTSGWVNRGLLKTVGYGTR